MTHLLTSIGTFKYEEAAYRLGPVVHRTRFAPVALARALGLGGARATVLVTEAAHARWYGPLAEELSEAGLSPDPLLIPEGRNEREILEIFEALVDRFGDGAQVVLDVTFALRHLPFVYLATLAYLVGLRDVRVIGIYYGAYTLRTGPAGEETAPIIDLTPLFGFLEWYTALRMGREAGDFRAVASALRRDVGQLFRQQMGDTALSRAGGAAEGLAASLASGLPLESGLEAARLRRAVGALGPGGPGAPAARRAIESLAQVLNVWSIRSSETEKSALPLSSEELDRQLRAARWYAEHGDLPSALIILREWVVNFLLYARGEHDDWLDHAKRRQPAERMLYVISKRAQAHLGTAAEKRVAALWESLRERRNPLAHGGMCPQRVRPSRGAIFGLLQECDALRKAPPHEFSALPKLGTKRLLVTALGLSPGVLYSAVLHIRPDHVVVISSAEASGRLEEAMARADAAGVPRTIIKLSDPHRGFDEIGQHLPSLGPLMIEACSLAANVTGGTTAMQYAVERVAAEAAGFGVPVCRVALIDRRSPTEQREHPYVAGELLCLDWTRPSKDDEQA